MATTAYVTGQIDADGVRRYRVRIPGHMEASGFNRQDAIKIARVMAERMIIREMPAPRRPCQRLPFT